MTTRPKIKALALFFLFFYSSQGIADIGSGKSYVKDGVYFSDVKLPFKLEQQQVEALDSGLTLRFQLNFIIVDVRNWRIDRDIGTLSQAYSIRLNAFTGRYLITNLNIALRQPFHLYKRFRVFFLRLRTFHWLMTQF